MSDAHGWIYQFHLQTLLDNRPDKARLIEILTQAEEVGKENPDQKLALYEQGRALAAQFEEPWWSAFFEYWTCEALLYYKHDPEAALDVAAKLVVETRKPLYQAFPHRVGINLNFIAAYSKIDPIGYAPQIRAAILEGEADWSRYDSFYPVYWQLRTRFLTAVGDPQALEVAWQHFDFSCDYHARRDTGSSHYIIYALADLLAALHEFDLLNAREQSAELAALGEELSRREENQRLSAIFTMWRAAGERYADRDALAMRFYRLALQKQAALSPPRNAVFVPALAFHHAGGESEKATEICAGAIEIALHHAHWFDAASYLAQKCELLRVLGRVWRQDAAQLREIAAKLPSKAVWEAKIRAWESEIAPE